MYIHAGQIGGLQCAPTARRSCARICLSIYTYARYLHVYMYARCITFAVRWTASMPSQNTAGWLGWLAGWLTGWLANWSASVRTTLDQPSLVRHVVSSRRRQDCLERNWSSGTGVVLPRSCGPGRVEVEDVGSSSGQLGRYVGPRCRPLVTYCTIKYRTGRAASSFSVSLTRAISFFVSSFSLLLAFRVRSDA